MHHVGSVLPLPALLVLLVGACAPSTGGAPDAAGSEPAPDAGTLAPDAGGPPNTCGSGTIEEGEECDLGPAADGVLTGCAPTCRFDGTCAVPVELGVAAVDDTEHEQGVIWKRISGFVGKGEDAGATVGSCGGAGPELVFRWPVEQPGLVLVQLESPWKVKVYAQAACGDAATERGVGGTSCADPGREANPQQLLVPVSAPGSLFLVVDSTPYTNEAEFKLFVRTLAYVDAGAVCGPARVDELCGPGSHCVPRSATAGECDPNTPPVVRSVRAIHGSADDREKLTVSFQGRDAEANPLFGSLELLDGAGTALPLFDGDLDGAPERAKVDFAVEAAPGADEFSAVVVGAVDEARMAAADGPKSVRLSLHDAGLLTGTLTAPIETFRTVGANQPCDPERLSNRCVTGTVCAESSTCRAVGTLRAEECAAAPAAVATRVIVSASGPSLWEPSCGGVAAANRPEAVLRLTLEQDARRAVVSTANPGTTFDTVVSLLPDCGLDGAAFGLGCSDDGAGVTPAGASVLELVDVPAGEYTVVVDSKNANGGAAAVTVTVE